jgi:hypothetical protein
MAAEKGSSERLVRFLEIHNPCPTTYYPIALLIVVYLELPGDSTARIAIIHTSFGLASSALGQPVTFFGRRLHGSAEPS